jgi:dipeptidyl aminopeptidase/acylaminoacyl peptidase
MAPPGQFDKIAAEASPLTYAGKRHDPSFLIIQGDSDSIVPLDQSQRLYDRLKEYENDVHLKLIPGAVHGGWHYDDPEIAALQEAFLNRTLRGGK